MIFIQKKGEIHTNSSCASALAVRLSPMPSTAPFNHTPTHRISYHHRRSTGNPVPILLARASPEPPVHFLARNSRNERSNHSVAPVEPTKQCWHPLAFASAWP